METKRNIDRIPFSELMDEMLKYREPEVVYTIGVDDTFNRVKSYCLTKTIVGVGTEIVLLKSFTIENEMHSVKTEFQTEVENLAKYFNATIITDSK